MFSAVTIGLWVVVLSGMLFPYVMPKINGGEAALTTTNAPSTDYTPTTTTWSRRPPRPSPWATSGSNRVLRKRPSPTTSWIRRRASSTRCLPDPHRPAVGLTTPEAPAPRCGGWGLGPWCALGGPSGQTWRRRPAMTRPAPPASSPAPKKAAVSDPPVWASSSVSATATRRRSIPRSRQRGCRRSQAPRQAGCSSRAARAPGWEPAWARGWGPASARAEARPAQASPESPGAAPG